MADHGDTSTVRATPTNVHNCPVKYSRQNKGPTFSFVTVGASSDLSKKKIYPTLWYLFRDKLLPNFTFFHGYSRSALSVEKLKDHCIKFIKMGNDDESRFKEFWELNKYTVGAYDEKGGYELLNTIVGAGETKSIGNRIFYVAVPHNLCDVVLRHIRGHCMSTKGWTRIIIEKPFDQGRDSITDLLDNVSALFREEEIFRIDHHIGKEVVQNLMTIRFANRMFGPTWSRDCIASVLIVCKEKAAVDDDASYFNKHGIIRDMMQNHLLQILSLVAMEKPASHNSEDIRDEKVKVLRAVAQVRPNDVVLGQYIGDSEGAEEAQQGYLDDPTIPNGSTTPTFATVQLRINNERWDGVPFIMKCGKALNENKTEVRIQFQDIPGDIFHGEPQRNELIIRVHPKEAVYLKLMTKTPGMSFGLEDTELELTYSNRYRKVLMPSVYERLFLDVFAGIQMHFVRSDELCEAWRIFHPLLSEIEHVKVQPCTYKHGSRGPYESDVFCNRHNYKYYPMNPCYTNNNLLKLG